MKIEAIEQSLKEVGFRATSGRIQVLQFLKQQHHPVGVDAIANAVPEVNLATLYRMMTDFVEKNLITAHDLGHGHVDYEIADKPHHHHAVCETCGLVEEIFSCDATCELQQSIMKATKKFATISTPSATVFGVCKKCS